MSGDLKFDKMLEEFSEASHYVRRLKNIFHSIGYEDNGTFGEDHCHHKIFYADYARSSTTFSLEMYVNRLSDQHLATLPIKLKALSQNIEKRKLLFSQIEFMVRQMDIEETKNIDLKLMVQNILYVSSTCKRKCYKSNVIVMHEKSPLATLGIVAQMLCAHEHVIIESTPATAVLCHLFTKLCHEVGLKNISLAFVEKSTAGGNDVTELEELRACCAGVVTERSDVDSAVAVFFASTTKYPWQIRRILVQESVGERLKNALAWKAKLDPSNEKLDEIKTKCSNVYGIGNKVYLYEYSGDEAVENYVIIEAYRTVKELLSLLNTCKPFAVSLWCCDVSESNEIAYGVESTVVWINDFGTFVGPPKSSQAFYSIIDVSFSRIGIYSRGGIEKLLTIRNNWNKLSAVEKREILYGVIKKCQKHTILYSENLLDNDNGDGSFVELADGRICAGVEVVAGEVMLHETGYELKDAVASVVKGNAVNYRWNDLIMGGLYGPMAEAGAPVDVVMDDTEGGWRVASQYSMYKIKVVWTTFGTIFAN